MGNVNYQPIEDDIMFGGARFFNLGVKSKKEPDFDFDLNLRNKTMAITKDIGSLKIAYYKDPETHLYVTNTSRTQANSNTVIDVSEKFRILIAKSIRAQWKAQYQQLVNLHDSDPDKYDKLYKPYKYLNEKMRFNLSNPVVMEEKLVKKFKLLPSETRQPLNINERLLFSDSIISEDYINTSLVPYNDPAKQHVTEDDQKVVKDFLSVFMDDENIRVFLWFMGACLSNIDSRKISKMLVVSSAKGGNGKNTLIEATANALFTPDYYDVKPGLDSYFNNTNRFALDDLIPLHLTVFGEAEFNSAIGEAHNFSGYNMNGFKSLISDGIFTSEGKFQKAMQRIAPYTFYITLTNNFPDISQDKQALNRRLLPLVLKSSSMSEKGRELKLKDRQAIFDYLESIRQSLANVCYHYYQDHQREFLNSEYDKTEAVEIIRENNQVQDDYAKNYKQGLKQLALIDPIKVIERIGEDNDLDFSKLIKLIKKSDPMQPDPNNKVFRWRKESVNGNDINVLYLNSSNNVLTSVTGDSNTRKILIDIFGNPIQVYSKRMIRIL